jgi:hypothetical protein
MLTLSQSTQSDTTARSSITQPSPITLLLIRALAPTRTFFPMRTDPFSPAVKSTRLPSPSQMALSSPSTRCPAIFTVTAPARMSWCASRYSSRSPTSRQYPPAT